MAIVTPIQASPAYAEAKFQFLASLGFRLEERWVTGGNSFRDGWRLTYSSSVVQVTISYLDSQLELVFTMAGTAADYLLLDRRLFARRSGWDGNMFPPQKLAGAIDSMSGDVQNNYAQVLGGDARLWGQIKSALETPKENGRLP